MRTLLVMLLACSFLAVYALSGCAQGSGATGWGEAPIRVRGTIVVRQRAVLSDEAVVTVQLVNAAIADRAGDIIVATTISSPGQFPIRFVLEYPPNSTPAGAKPIFRVQIFDRGMLRFTSTAAVPFDPAHPENEVEIVVTPL